MIIYLTELWICWEREETKAFSTKEKAEAYIKNHTHDEGEFFTVPLKLDDND